MLLTLWIKETRKTLTASQVSARSTKNNKAQTSTRSQDNHHRGARVKITLQSRGEELSEKKNVNGVLVEEYRTVLIRFISSMIISGLFSRMGSTMNVRISIPISISTLPKSRQNQIVPLTWTWFQGNCTNHMKMNSRVIPKRAHFSRFLISINICDRPTDWRVALFMWRA